MPSLAALFTERVNASRKRVACRSRRRGAWRETAWGAWNELSLALASGLRALGLQMGDRVALISTTRVEWIQTEMGIQLAGGISVTLFPESPPRLTRNLIRQSGVRFAIVDTPLQLAKLLDTEGDSAPIDPLEAVIYFDARASLPPHEQQNTARQHITLDEVVWPPGDAIISFDELLERGNARRRDPILDADPDAIATVLYTPGTTGTPHPVELSHRNLAAAGRALVSTLELSEEDSQLLVLPLAHSFARVLVVASLLEGIPIGFSEEMAGLVADMAELQPTFLASVPWVFERVHAKILNDARAVGPVRRAFFEWALNVGQETPQEGRWHKLRGRVAKRMAFKKLHDIFGERLRFFISIGGPLHSDVAQFFQAADLRILESYGLAECSGLVTLSRPEQHRTVCVGEAVDGLDLDPREGGELFVRGPLVSPAHRDAQGWLATGDRVEIDDEGYLQICCRMSEVIVLEDGTEVLPRSLEERLQQHPLVSQVLIYGHERPFLTALLTLDEEASMRWAEEHNLEFESFAELTQDRRVFELLRTEVDEINRERAPAPTIEKIALLEQGFSPETGELTPLLQMRRHFIIARYRSVLDSFYEEQF